MDEIFHNTSSACCVRAYTLCTLTRLHAR